MGFRDGIAGAGPAAEWKADPGCARCFWGNLGQAVSGTRSGEFPERQDADRTAGAAGDGRRADELGALEIQRDEDRHGQRPVGFGTHQDRFSVGIEGRRPISEKLIDSFGDRPPSLNSSYYHSHAKYRRRFIRARWLPRGIRLKKVQRNRRHLLRPKKEIWVRVLAVVETDAGGATALIGGSEGR